MQNLYNAPSGVRQRRLFLQAAALTTVSGFFAPTALAQALVQRSVDGWAQKVADLGSIKLHYVEQGKGPLVMLLHGFPESWFSWRHQIKALSAAGYRVVAPSLRGYGQTTSPKDVDAYGIKALVSDLVGLMDVLGEKSCVLVGHDFGAVLTWNAALLAPERFRALVPMSVPYDQRGSTPPMERIGRLVGSRFSYLIYFQTPGAAEAELEPRLPAFLRAFYYTASAEGRHALSRIPPAFKSAVLMDTLADSKNIPSWLTQDEFDFYVSEFTRNGLSGPLKWYRNLDANWAQMAEFGGAVISQPTLFIAGEHDPVLRNTKANFDRLPVTVPKLHKVALVPDAGHWVQQEQATAVNNELLEFLRMVHK